jgi:hypothetical protein
MPSSFLVSAKYEDSAAATVARKRGRHEAFDKERLAVQFEALSEGGRWLVELLERITRRPAHETHMRRCGFDRSGIDSVQPFDRREFSFGAAESVGDLMKLHPN